MRTDKFLSRASFVALFAFMFGGVYGQDSLSVTASQPEPVKLDTLDLSLQQAIEVAMNENPTVKVNEMEITKANYARRESRAGLFPNIGASGSYTRNVKKQVMSFAGQNMEIGTDNQWSAGFNAGMPLVNVTLWKSIQLSDAAVDAKVQAALSSKISLVSQVIAGYYQILNAQDSYEVLKKSYNLAVENYDIAKKRYNQGMASEYDALQAEVQVKNLKPTLLSTENAIELLKLQLKVLMGVPSSQPIKVQGSLADYEQDMFEVADVTDMDSALMDNPTLKELEISTNLLEKQLELQKAQWYPTLSLSFVYQWISQNDNFKMADYEWNPYSTLGLTLSIPIFQGGARYYKQKQAQIAYDEMQYTVEDVRYKLGMQVQSAIDNIRVAVEKIEATKDAKESAEKGLRISQKRYEVGAGSFLELTSSDNANTQAQHAYFQAIYDYIVAKNSLDEVLGNAYNEYIK
ncbi:MAG: TolC family protein [Paludibacteraceae bacterium]|jgi:outer membrane protein TolC|nr:TolC family protein [Paludibacteraceae bacterium]MEE0996389.1 TolC family protein [Paludibacteraceae bacterium]MEE1541379.1 TolC family protein [Paludibacteraceae bacterium]